MHFVLYSCHVNACIGRYIHVHVSCTYCVGAWIGREVNAYVGCYIDAYILDAALVHTLHVIFMTCECMHWMLYFMYMFHVILM